MLDAASKVEVLVFGYKAAAMGVCDRLVSGLCTAALKQGCPIYPKSASVGSDARSRSHIKIVFVHH